MTTPSIGLRLRFAPALPASGLWLATIALPAALLLLPATASAQASPCLRDSDCNGPTVCLDQTCTEAEHGLNLCNTEDDCRGAGEICDDGVCRDDRVTCNNPAGRCWVGQSSTECECVDGSGGGSAGGFDPDNPPVEQTDEELYAQCTEQVVDFCGEQAPDPDVLCSPEQRTLCEDFFEVASDAVADCGDGPIGSNDAAVAGCCVALGDGPEFEEAIQCAIDSRAQTCNDLEACEPEGGPGRGDGSEPDEAAGSGTGQAGTSGPDDGAGGLNDGARGCRSHDGGGTGLMLAPLLLLGGWLRRRRRAS